MKKVIFIFFACLLGVQFSLSAQSKNEGNTRSLSLMSYNIKFASPSFEPSWDVRKEWQVDLIRKYSPDIIGTQEGLKKQIDYLQNELTEYVVIGEGRKGGDDDEHMAIFFKRDKFRLREMGSFQLSNTPEIIGSGPEVNPRMVTWARLAFIDISDGDKDNSYPQDYRGHWENIKEFYVFNTHFFHGGKDTLARLNAARLIMDRVKQLERFGEWETERPVFLMGDFNCRPGSPPYLVLVGNNAHNRSTFDDSVEGGRGIDWILYKGNAQVFHYEQVDYNVDGIYPSDHKPVFVRFLLPQ